ncbi:VP1 [Temminck's stint calicivirus]|nr:VP1 [Temminck's stint calicivirus]
MAIPSLIAGGLGAASSLISGISSPIFHSQQLALQKEQLKLNQQALAQNKEMSLASMALTASMPTLEAKASGLAAKAQLDAKMDFYRRNGADPISLMAIGQGKTVFSSGSTRVATVYNTNPDYIRPFSFDNSTTPIVMDLTPRKPQTASRGVQAVPQTKNNSTWMIDLTRQKGTQTSPQTRNGYSQTNVMTSQTATQTNILRGVSTQTSTKRPRQAQRTAMVGNERLYQPASHFYPG